MVIIDSSIAYKWLIDEDIKETALARQLLERFLAHDLDLIVPDILLYELANILSFKTSLSSRDTNRAWQQFKKYQLPIYYPNWVFIKKCINFAGKHKVTIYDASFAVLAQEERCALITADRKFVTQVRLPFVKHLSEI